MITIQNLSKSFGDNHVLRGLSLDIHKGESMVIIGPSGSGKSVMLKCLMGLLGQDGGTMVVDGDHVDHRHRHSMEMIRSKIGMVFQGSALFDSLPVWENICFRTWRRSPITRDQAIAIAEEKLQAVGLRPQTAFLFPAELSGGMQRRVALARAIATAPQILLCDEPTAGLDPIMSRIISDFIRSNVRDLGATALTITHDMTAARIIGDRVGMIWGGQIIWEGAVETLNHSGHPYVEQFTSGASVGPMTCDGEK